MSKYMKCQSMNCLSIKDSNGVQCTYNCNRKNIIREKMLIRKVRNTNFRIKGKRIEEEFKKERIKLC